MKIFVIILFFVMVKVYSQDLIIKKDSTILNVDIFYFGNDTVKYLNDSTISEEKKMPYFWASFVLVGNDNVLDLNENKGIYIKYILILFIISLVVFIGFYMYRLKIKKSIR